jgi:hypothetical protein
LNRRWRLRALVHNRRVTHDSLELIERARRRLQDNDLPFSVAGGVAEEAIAAAEQTLDCKFPPSYRGFLRRFGGLTLPARLSTIQQFVGLSGGSAEGTVVDRTNTARVENRLGDRFVIVAIGVEHGEWFCLDVDRPDAAGECPVMLFDARDNQIDQQFYDDFDSMLREVLTFVLETLDALDAEGDLDVAAESRAASRSYAT